jgi:hypothetical protein
MTAGGPWQAQRSRARVSLPNCLKQQVPREQPLPAHGALPTCAISVQSTLKAEGGSNRATLGEELPTRSTSSLPVCSRYQMLVNIAG